MRTIRHNQAGFVPVLVAVLVILCAGASLAANSDMQLFKNHYSVRSPVLTLCTVCHLPNDNTKLNQYGTDWKTAGAVETAFPEVERKDSDRDGFSNKMEIEGGSNPGDVQSVPGAGNPDMPSRKARAPRVEGGHGPGEAPGEGPTQGPANDPFAEGPATGPGTTPPAGDTGATRVAPGDAGTTPPPGGPARPPGPGTDWTTSQPVTPTEDPFAVRDGGAGGATTPPVGPTTATVPPPTGPAAVQPTGPAPGPAVGAAVGDPFDGYPVLYRTAEGANSAVHLLQNGVDTVISQGVTSVDPAFGWSPDGKYAWFVSVLGELYLWSGGQAKKVSGDVVVDPNVVAWSRTGRMVFFGSYSPSEQNVFYGVTVPEGTVARVLEVPAGQRLTGMDVAPRP